MRFSMKHHTWLDGIAESSRFYMALGQFDPLGGSSELGQIAGPRCRTPNKWWFWHVELYIRLK